MSESKYIKTQLPEELVIDILDGIESDDVRKAVDYYMSLPNSITPIEDQGWLKFSPKVRMRAGEVIAQISL